jgi:hypothetical protein
MMTLRQHMHALEGRAHAEWAIGHGFQAWAVERLTGSEGYRVTKHTAVFAKSRSDALRKASAPARLGEECHTDVTEAVRIAAHWDDPL